MTNIDFKKLVNKYAVILIINYGLTFLLGILLQRVFSATSENNESMSMLIMSAPLFFQLCINIVIALIVKNDFDMLKIKSNWVIIATILFSFVGVCMFLLLANREVDKVGV